MISTKKLILEPKMHQQSVEVVEVSLVMLLLLVKFILSAINFLVSSWG